MNTDLKQYKNLYLETARVYLHAIAEDLTLLRNDPAHQYAINDIYISSHSLKSQSSVMGFRQIASVCKTIEQLFHELKGKEQKIQDDIIETMSYTLDKLILALDIIEKTDNEPDVSDIMNHLKSVTLRE